ncbi:uncharacterized protein PHACADRAFT_154268 [Phanerochaete carnosa HHB-10118-sp]|uniref:Major facilitator superfamily (MFS) profile domain-containing protein n=1 Tax=Phanerochaete carnosa (strain HHB-10118-sp) TaxID=650164 RepID=K5VT20_PHACS|nr:uncharacterized protein PHACADRAFT_154268 [Phanerochaete carnosa HHB-10118-sp]EKM49729.1 hypothetical protein PHACADRAFT_154268 [Phanerochaete carnosa HHB-10118-sp]
MHKLLSALHEWRTRPSVVLPLAFLQALAVGLDNLPSAYLFRAIRCKEYLATSPSHAPEDDICRSPVVQKAYSTDIAVFATILAVLGIVLSGPYGRVSDFRGRKRALTISAVLNVLGNAWLALCSFSAPLRKSWLLQIAAVVQGLGGGVPVVMAGQNAFIADTSFPGERSSYMGLALGMFWAGNAVGPLVSAVLLNKDLYTINFVITVLVWVLYLLYLLFVVREVRVPVAEHYADANAADAPDRATEYQSVASRLFAPVRSVFEPVIILVQHVTLLLLSIALAVGVFCLGVFHLIIPYCDTKFGLGPSEAGIISAAWSVSRAASVMFLLPMCVAAYQWLVNRKQAAKQLATAYATVPADETAPLLAEATQELQASESTPPAEATSISRELTIVRVCLVLDALGMLAVGCSRNANEVVFATVVGAFGAPAGPSMQALVTLAAPPGETGRVLAGLSILQSAAVALRGPVLVSLFNATLVKAPGAIWWLSALMLILSSLVAFGLRPRQFVYVYDGHT